MRNQTVYSLNGKFTDIMTSLPYAQLGSSVFDMATKSWYQLVHMSATAGDLTPPAPAAGLIAYWKDSDTFEVCTHNHAAIAEGLANSIAGILKAALTIGTYGWVQKSGRCALVGDGTTTISVGLRVQDAAADDGSVVAVALGDPSAYVPLGVIISVTDPYSSTAPLVQLELIKE
jgi:hypothetical protein